MGYQDWGTKGWCKLQTAKKINGFEGKSNYYMIIFLYVLWKGSLKFGNDQDAGYLLYAHKLFLINGYFL